VYIKQVCLLVESLLTNARISWLLLLWSRPWCDDPDIWTWPGYSQYVLAHQKLSF